MIILCRFSTYKTLTMKSSVLQIVAKFGAIAAIFAGIGGMFFCLPFLFSSNMADLVGAGFPFIGGAIIASAGLLSLTILARNQRDSN